MARAMQRRSRPEESGKWTSSRTQPGAGARRGEEGLTLDEAGDLITLAAQYHRKRGTHRRIVVDNEDFVRHRNLHPRAMVATQSDSSITPLPRKLS